VREEVPDGDAVLAVARELRNELRQRIVQPDAPLFHQLHHARRRRHDFRQRGEIEDRVFGHRLGYRGHDPLAERLVIDNRVAAAGGDDRAGQFMTRDSRMDQWRNRSESSRRLSRLCRTVRGRPTEKHGRNQRRRQRDSFHGIQYILREVID
jgi:hypothetical protein